MRLLPLPLFEQAIRARLNTRAGFPFSQTIFDEDLKTLALELDWV